MIDQIVAVYSLQQAIDAPLLVNTTSLEAYQNNVHYVHGPPHSTTTVGDHRDRGDNDESDLEEDLEMDLSPPPLFGDINNSNNTSMIGGGGGGPLGGDLSTTTTTTPINNYKNLDDLIIGNGIKNNGAFPLHQLTKQPCYNLTFKNHIMDNSNIDLESIQTLPNGSSNQFLNSLLIRLPLVSSSSSSSSSNGNSILNGLPNYNLIQLRNNLQLAESSSSSSSSSSSPRYSIDEIELYHNNVIINKFINNKRRIRDYQWLKYFSYKSGSTNNLLSYAKKVSKNSFYLSNFNKKMNLKRERIMENNKSKSNLVNLIKNLKNQLNDKITNELNFTGANVNSIEFANQINSKFKFEKDEILKNESNLKSLNEIDFDKFYQSNNDDNDDEFDNYYNQFSNNFSNRFNQNLSSSSSSSSSLEIIIEKEFKIDDPNLIKYQNQLLGQQKAFQFQQSLKNSNGTINSNIVRFKWIPNPNSIGFTNINNKKPSFII